MIIYFVTLRNAFAMEDFLRTWGRELKGVVRTAYYENIRFHKTWPAATYIFSDIERLNEPQRELAVALATRLKDAGCPVLNDPAHTPRRYALLRVLHEQNVNHFNAYRVNELPRSGEIRFPVFVRRANAHDGSLTPLLHTPAELERAIASPAVRAYAHEELIVVEFVDTSDSHGVFRKYSVLRVGQSVAPRHVLWSREWMNKSPDMIGDESVREETGFIDSNPHADVIRRIFDLARIDFGRVDYGMKDGQVQVWEINTSPVVMALPSAVDARRMKSQTCSARQITDAFVRLDTYQGATPVKFELDTALVRAFGWSLRQRLLRPLGWWSRTFPNASKRFRAAIRFRG